jgi:hypothetical protein
MAVVWDMAPCSLVKVEVSEVTAVSISFQKTVIFIHAAVRT